MNFVRTDISHRDYNKMLKIAETEIKVAKNMALTALF